MMFNNRFWGQCTDILLYGKGLIQGTPQGLRKGFCGLHVNRPTLHSVIYRPEGNARGIGDTGPC